MLQLQLQKIGGDEAITKLFWDKKLKFISNNI